MTTLTRTRCRPRCTSSIRRLARQATPHTARTVEFSLRREQPTRLLQEPLHDDHIPPHAIELGVLFIHSDLAKAQALNQPPAGLILDKNAREQLPESGL